MEYKLYRLSTLRKPQAPLIPMESKVFTEWTDYSEGNFWLTMKSPSHRNGTFSSHPIRVILMMQPSSPVIEANTHVLAGWRLKLKSVKHYHGGRTEWSPSIDISDIATNVVLLCSGYVKLSNAIKLAFSLPAPILAKFTYLSKLFILEMVRLQCKPAQEIKYIRCSNRPTLLKLGSFECAL